MKNITFVGQQNSNYDKKNLYVINTQSGVRISYQAYREDIQNNSFTTVEGRKVFTAGIERIEIEAPPE